MDLLSPDSGTIFWTVLTFVCLLLILKKFGWKPILKTLEDRENRIKTAIEQAEQGQKEVLRLKEEQENLLKKLRQDSAEIINQSKMDADAVRKKILEQAREEAEKVLSQAKKEIDLSKLEAIKEIKEYAVELSLTAAQRVVGEMFSKDQHQHLIEKSIEELTQSK